jgi:hypothetical protein
VWVAGRPTFDLRVSKPVKYNFTKGGRWSALELNFLAFTAECFLPCLCARRSEAGPILETKNQAKSPLHIPYHLPKRHYYTKIVITNETDGVSVTATILTPANKTYYFNNSSFLTADKM